MEAPGSPKSELALLKNIFKDVKFYLIGKINDKEEIVKLLEDGGAKQNSYLTDMVTHVIADNEDNPEISEAKDLFELPVIISKWVSLSVYCHRQLPLSAFHSEPNKLFLGIIACPSQLSANDAKVLWSLITFYGGQCQLDLEKTCTHLITTKPSGSKYDYVLSHCRDIKVVTPDWVIECVSSKTRQPEEDYHPCLIICKEEPLVESEPSVEEAILDDVEPEVSLSNLQIESPDVPPPVSTPICYPSTSNFQSSSPQAPSQPSLMTLEQPVRTYFPSQTIYSSPIQQTSQTSIQNQFVSTKVLQSHFPSQTTQLVTRPQFLPPSQLQIMSRPQPPPHSHVLTHYTSSHQTTSPPVNQNYLSQTNSLMKNYPSRVISQPQPLVHSRIQLSPMQSFATGNPQIRLPTHNQPQIPSHYHSRFTFQQAVRNPSLQQFRLSSQLPRSQVQMQHLVTQSAQPSSSSLQNSSPTLPHSITLSGQVYSLPQTIVSAPFMSSINQIRTLTHPLQSKLQTSQNSNLSSVHIRTPALTQASTSMSQTFISHSAPHSLISQQTSASHPSLQSLMVSHVPLCQPSSQSPMASRASLCQPSQSSLVSHVPLCQPSTHSLIISQTSSESSSQSLIVTRTPLPHPSPQSLMVCQPSSQSSLSQASLCQPTSQSLALSQSPVCQLSTQPLPISHAPLCQPSSEALIPQTSLTQPSSQSLMLSHGSQSSLVTQAPLGQSSSQTLMTSHGSQSSLITQASFCQPSSQPLTTSHDSHSSLLTQVPLCQPSSQTFTTSHGSQSSLVTQSSFCQPSSQSLITSHGARTSLVIQAHLSQSSQQPLMTSHISQPSIVTQAPLCQPSSQPLMTSHYSQPSIVTQLPLCQSSSQSSMISHASQPSTVTQPPLCQPLSQPLMTYHGSQSSLVTQVSLSHSSPQALMTSHSSPSSLATQPPLCQPSSQSSIISHASQPSTVTQPALCQPSSQPLIISHGSQPSLITQTSHSHPLAQALMTSHGSQVSTVTQSPLCQPSSQLLMLSRASPSSAVTQSPLCQTSSQSLMISQPSIITQIPHCQPSSQSLITPHTPQPSILTQAPLCQPSSQPLVPSQASLCLSSQALLVTQTSSLATCRTLSQSPLISVCRSPSQSSLAAQASVCRSPSQIPASKSSSPLVIQSSSPLVPPVCYSPVQSPLVSQTPSQSQISVCQSPKSPGLLTRVPSQFLSEPKPNVTNHTLQNSIQQTNQFVNKQFQPHTIQPTIPFHSQQLNVSTTIAPPSHTATQITESSPHNSIQNSPQAQLISQTQVTPQTKTALAKLLNTRLQHSGVVPESPETGQPLSRLQNMINSQQMAGSLPRTLRNITNSSLLQRDQPLCAQTSSQVIHVQFYGHDPNIKVPPDLCLLGCIFVIADYDKVLDPEMLETWKKVIFQHGGQVEKSYSATCTHVLCENQRNSVVQQAMREGKRCVTAHWLNDCLLQKKMVAPWLALHLPTPFSDDRPCKNQIITVTNFEGEERIHLKHMISTVGARYTGYMTRNNTALICKKAEGLKHDKAKEWKIPIINVQWLNDILFGHCEALRFPQANKFQQFSLQDCFRIDYALVPHLMASWRTPIKISPDVWKNFLPTSHIKSQKGSENSTNKRRASQKIYAAAVKKIRSPSWPTIASENKLVILITGFQREESEDLKQKVLQLGGTLTASAKECSHLVANNLTRTVKFLCAISVCDFIVQPQWIHDSFQLHKFQDESLYRLQDPSAEKLYSCELQQSLMRARRSPLFKNITFYITPGVQPPPVVMKEIIECAGGKLVHNRPSARKILQLNGNGCPTFLIISCENDLHLCKDVISHNIAIYNAEFILTGALRQQFDFQTFLLQTDK